MSELNQEEIRKKALEFLRENRWAVLATATKDGQPHGATMNYYVDDDFTFYFISMEETKKLGNLRENKQAAIVVGFGPAPITIQGEGEAELREKNDKELLYKISGTYSLDDLTKWPILRIARGVFTTIIFKPSYLVWLNLDEEGHPETFSEKFHRVI